MSVSVSKVVLQMLGLFIGFALLIFLPAGTLRWCAGWVFLAIFFGGGIVIVLWLLKLNPALLNERMIGLGRSDQKAWDKQIMAAIIPLYIVWLIVMPLDAVRYHWSHIPLWAQAGGGVLFCFSYYMLFLTYRENPFLSPAVRIQRERNQTVISTGPYSYIRHPMYASYLVQFIGVSFLLGSWVGLLVGLLFMVVVARRAVLEERMLCEELPGYKEYMTHVKYRLIPYVW